MGNQGLWTSSCKSRASRPWFRKTIRGTCRWNEEFWSRKGGGRWRTLIPIFWLSLKVINPLTGEKMWVSLYIRNSCLMLIYLTLALPGTSQVKPLGPSWEKSLLQWKNAVQRRPHFTVSRSPGPSISLNSNHWRFLLVVSNLDILKIFQVSDLFTSMAWEQHMIGGLSNAFFNVRYLHSTVYR